MSIINYEFEVVCLFQFSSIFSFVTSVHWKRKYVMETYFNMITGNNNWLLKLRSQVDLKITRFLSLSQTKSKSALLVKTKNTGLKKKNTKTEDDVIMS